LDAAFATLKSWWQQTKNAELSRTGLLAIAMLRNEPAFEFLILLIAEGKHIDAKNAIAALSIYQNDLELWKRVRQVVEQRGDIRLLQEIE
jgi:hypothetical protein